MKKTMMTMAIVFLVCVASIFALAACNFDNLNYTEDYDSSDKEGSVELVNNFFAETLKDPDFVVTCKNKDGEVQFTENVKGTSSYSLSNDGSKLYAYKVGDFFYVANESQQVNDEGETETYHNYFCSDNTKQGFFHEYESTINGEKKTVTMKDIYDGYYCQFKSALYGGIGILEYLTEKDGTFDCKSHAERTDGVTTGSLTLTYTTTSGTITIMITSENNLVKSYRVVTTGSNPTDNTEYTMTFEYGNASVTPPDTDKWDLEAITMDSIVSANDISSIFFEHSSMALAFEYPEDGEEDKEALADYVYISEDYRIEVYGKDVFIIGNDDMWECVEENGEKTFYYHWYAMSEEEEEMWRDVPLNFAYLNAEATSKETINNIEKNADGTLTIKATLNAEDMKELLQDEYPDGKTVEERTEYVVNALTLEIVSSSVTVIVDGEVDSVTSINPFYDVEIPDNLKAIITAINEVKSGEKVNPRTIRIIYDYGTDEEETYEVVADSRYKVIPNLRDGYEMFSDPEKKEVYEGSDGTSDVTIYAFVEE